MTGIGMVGLGFMGMIHYLAADRLEGGGVVALCSRDPKKLEGDWRGIRGNFGPRGTIMDLSGKARYREIADLLADPAVELVDLCVPSDQHARLAVRALEAGKHVLVEKPLALNLADADAMVAAARASGKLLMVAQVLPFFPEFAWAREAIGSGRYGALRAAHLKRLIARPDWSSSFADPARSGGPALDLHIHDTHFLCLVCGVPRSVQSCGVVEGEAVVYLSSQYRFGDPNLAVSAVAGAICQPGRPFAQGFEFDLEGATLAFEFADLGERGAVTNPLTVLLADGTVERPDLGSGDPVAPFTAELAAAVESVASGTPAAALTDELARQALGLCLAEIQSVRTRQSIALC